MTEPLLMMKGIGRTFRRRGMAPVVALDSVDLTIADGECVGLVGESGSGKSTLARIAVGLETADTGELHRRGVDRRDTGRAARHQRARFAQKVFQDPYGSLDRRMTAHQALVQALRIAGHERSRAKEMTENLCDQVGLTAEQLQRTPRDLSGGQRQRVAIARCLAADPKLLVMDEALSALDATVRRRILELVAELRREKKLSILFVTHDLTSVGGFCDRLVVLRRGHVVEMGEAASVVSRPEQPYTKLLVASIPGPGWKPERVAELRRDAEA